MFKNIFIRNIEIYNLPTLKTQYLLPGSNYAKREGMKTRE